MIVAGLDPGLAYVGYALVEFSDKGREVLALGTAHTQQSGRKGSVRQMSDTTRRAREVWREVRKAWGSYPQAICLENPIPNLRNSTVRAKIGYTIGSVVLYAELLDIAVLEVTPAEIKLALFNRRSAQKGDVIKRVEEIYPGISWPTTTVRGASSTEMASHAADALGAIEACLVDPTVQALRQLRG